MYSLNSVADLLKYCLNHTATCTDGDLRLLGGDFEYEGLLQVCFGQRWGTVNGDGWSSKDTQVACTQLGFETSGNWWLILCVQYITQCNCW